MSKFVIEIQKKTSRQRVQTAQLKSVTRDILKALGWKTAALSILLVSDRQIRVINRRHLKHDRATDVISFSQLEGRRLKMRTPHLGDIVISLDTTEAQAKQYGNPFFYELCFYVCHGILHLMGRSDDTPRKARLMHLRQERILGKIGLAPEKKAKRGGAG